MPLVFHVPAWHTQGQILCLLFFVYMAERHPVWKVLIIKKIIYLKQVCYCKIYGVQSQKLYCKEY